MMNVRKPGSAILDIILYVILYVRTKSPPKCHFGGNFVCNNLPLKRVLQRLLHMKFPVKWHFGGDVI